MRVIGTAQSFDVMIDIETLSTKPDAVVLSVGAVAFNMQNEQIIINDSNLDLTDQFRLGRRVDADTLHWWMRQDDLARTLAFGEEGREPVHRNTLFEMVLRDTGCGPEAFSKMRYIWANSPSFDLVILNDLFGKEGCFWNYRQERDVRTICDGLDYKPEMHAQDGVAHTPVWDCMYQIKKVRNAWMHNHGEANNG